MIKHCWLILAAAGLALAQSQIAIVSSANYQSPVAPASIASVFGSGLSIDTATAQLDSGGQLPEQLAGVSARIGGQAAQLLYVSPQQINLVIPAAAPPGTVDVVIESSAGRTFSGAAEVRNAAPGLFSLDQSGGGPGAILNAVTFAGGPFLVDTQANLGDDKRTRLAIYGTGLRYAGNPFLDPTVVNVAARVTAQARDGAGNIFDLKVEFAGAAPVFFGLDQVNVVLPPQLDGAGTLSLTVTAENAASNAVSFTVNSLPAESLRLVGLSLSPSSATAGSNITGTVTLNAPAGAGGFAVSLSSNNNAAQTPATVTVAAGQISADFSIQTSTNAGGSAVIAASANGVSRTALLIVNSANGPNLATLALSADSIGGGSSLTGTVRLTGAAPAGGAIVQLSSSDTAAQTPATVTIPFGQSSATFNIATVAVTDPKTATITATLGSTAATATLTVNPLFTLKLSADSVTAGQSVTATVTLANAAPSSGATVRFSSSNSLLASVPQFVILSAGRNSATIAIATNTTTAVRSVTITATFGSISRSVSLSVNPPGAVSLANLALNPPVASGGSSVTGVVTLSAPAAGSGVSVMLQSSSTLAARVPASVTVASGQITANFTINTSHVTSSQSVTITASAGGVTKTGILTVQ